MPKVSNKKVTNKEFGIYLIALGSIMQDKNVAFEKLVDSEKRIVEKLEEYGMDNSRAIYVFDICWGCMRGVRPSSYF